MDKISEETTLNPIFVKAREVYVAKLRSSLEKIKMSKVSQSSLDILEKNISEIERGVKRDNTIELLQYYSDKEFPEKQAQDDFLEEVVGGGIKNINIKKINEGLDNGLGFSEIKKILNFDQDADFVAFAKASNKCYNIGEIISILEDSKKKVNIQKINEGLDNGFKVNEINIQKINEGLDNGFEVNEIEKILKFDHDADFVAYAKANKHADKIDFIRDITSYLNINKKVNIKKINEGLDNGLGFSEIEKILKFDHDADFVAFAKANKNADKIDFIRDITSYLNINKKVNIKKINEGIDNGFKFNEIEKILKFDHDADFVAFAKANNKCYNIGEIISILILNRKKNVNIQKINEGLDNGFDIDEINAILKIKADVDFKPLAGGDINEIIQMLRQNKI